MTPEELKTLEQLIDKLAVHVQATNISITNNVVQDGYCLATFDSEGIRTNVVTGPDLKYCLRELSPLRN